MLFNIEWSDYNRKRAWCASSPQTANAVAHLRVRHVKAGCLLEATAGTSEHGLVPRERCSSLVRYPFIEHRSTTKHAGP